MSKGTVVLTQALLVALLFLVLLLLGPVSAAEHNHPSRDAQVHEQFYNKWDRPDFPGNNCCHKNDCYPTTFKRIGGNWYALSRTVEKNDVYAVIGYTLNDPDDPNNWVLIPPERMEQNQYPGRMMRSNIDGKDYVMRDPLDSPDGRSHVCMIETAAGIDSPGFAPAGRWFVLCAVLGDGA